MFAIYRENATSGDIIWLDAVTDKDESYSSSLTKHPIEKGASISDHKVNEPISIRLSGVISDYDFHNTRPILKGEDLSSKNKPDDKDKGVHIGDNTDLSRLLLPESLNNLVNTVKGKKIPEVKIDRFSNQEATKTKELLKLLFNSGEPITLLGFNGNEKVDNFTNLVITNINFPETSDSYDAVYFNMTLEEVFVTVLRKGTTPLFIAPKEEVKNSCAPKLSGAGSSGSGAGNKGIVPDGSANAVASGSPLETKVVEGNVQKSMANEVRNGTIIDSSLLGK